MSAPLDDITVFAPIIGASLEQFLAKASCTLSRPFSDQRIEILDGLSKELLKSKVLRADPASVALAFWLRKANLVRLKADFLARFSTLTHAVVVPCGKVFHIAPSNVDTIFVYSWALAFLCGNSNIVRLSSKTSGIVSGILDCVRNLMCHEPVLAAENYFVQYERSEDINALFSSWCSHRVIWGGDETIQAIRRVRLNPQASERAFASKYSWSIVDSSAFTQAEEAAQSRLVKAFFNDVFWFDQMACSSPQVVFWIGGQAISQQARQRFDDLLSATLSKKGRSDDASVAVRRRNHAFSLAVSSAARFSLAQSGFTSAHVTNWRSLRKEACGGGFLVHTEAMDLADIIDFASDKDQTITHFGFSEEALRAFAVEVGSRGVDRLVPVGSALDFHHDWDGFSLLQDFTRTVGVHV